MRIKLLAVGVCVLALGWPAVGGAQTTTTPVPGSRAHPRPAPPPPPVATAPTKAQIAAFLRLLVPANTGSGRRIVYSVRGERVWVVDENNELVRTYKVSG